MTPLEYLRSVVSPLIPDETFSLIEARSGRMHILTLDVPDGRARGIILGKGGETLNSLRRILTVFAALRGETVTVYFNTERNSPNVRSEASRQS